AYIHVPRGYPNNRAAPDERHKAVFCVTVTQAGTYRLRARVYATAVGQNSFYVRMDEGAAVVWHVPVGGTYTQAQLSTTFVLAAGRHRLTFYWREAGVRLDRFEVYR
ncbi:MAG: hypothetical protein N2383_04520, partial [Caldilineales bacterium]|nr:hypothetical protein [Caldilineales bacterium]